MSAFNIYAAHTIGGAHSSGTRAIESIVLQTFRGAMDFFASQITRAIIEGTVVAARLDSLEERLVAIHMICQQEARATNDEVYDLIFDFWTFVGGNLKRFRELRERAAVLQDVERYRGLAVAYVAATAQILTGVDADLSELRDKLSAASIAENPVPVGVQLTSIEDSVTRLKDGQSKNGARLTIT